MWNGILEIYDFKIDKELGKRDDILLLKAATLKEAGHIKEAIELCSRVFEKDLSSRSFQPLFGLSSAKGASCRSVAQEWAEQAAHELTNKITTSNPWAREVKRKCREFARVTIPGSSVSEVFHGHRQPMLVAASCILE